MAIRPMAARRHGRTIDWVVNDGANPSPPATSTIDVIHAPPTITVGGTVSFSAAAAR